MSEQITYIPPVLKYLLADGWAEKRFKNRDGYAVLRTDGSEVEVQGNLLSIHKSALQHVALSPNNQAIVYEHRCNSSGTFMRDLEA